MSNVSYAARTNHAFMLSETVMIAQLICQEESEAAIRQKVLVEDIFQMRSHSSRERTLQNVLKRLHNAPPIYLELLANGSLDVRRLTNLFLILRENRLLCELIDEVLLEKLQHFDVSVRSADLRSFFETKREQIPNLAKWSDSTYQKVVSSTVSILVHAGLLQVSKPRGNYEIRSIPVPSVLREQLIADGFSDYLKLLLN
ncbi:DUF1819 family protein [Pseudanabaenaceae cyanobacterium LEGE 13415]|nr:DUF1819 family protein [Pseudanabaenaceae cyanobacterium LEGE 13415]